jgi:hypothetical protein
MGMPVLSQKKAHLNEWSKRYQTPVGTSRAIEQLRPDSSMESFDVFMDDV